MNTKYLIGTLCGGLIECPEFSFSSPYIIVEEAPSLEEALEFYNRKFHCDFFYSGLIATIINENISNYSDDISKNELNNIFNNAIKIKYYNIPREKSYFFNGSKMSRYGCDIKFWDSLSDLKEVLMETDDLYIDGTNDEGLSCVWNKNTCIGYTNFIV